MSVIMRVSLYALSREEKEEMHSSGFLLFPSILFTLLQRQIVFLLSKSTSNRKDAIILTFYTIPTERLTRWLRSVKLLIGAPMEHRCQCDVVIASSSKSNHLRNSRHSWYVTRTRNSSLEDCNSQLLYSEIYCQNK